MRKTGPIAAGLEHICTGEGIWALQGRTQPTAVGLSGLLALSEPWPGLCVVVYLVASLVWAWEVLVSRTSLGPLCRMGLAWGPPQDTLSQEVGCGQRGASAPLRGGCFSVCREDGGILFSEAASLVPWGAEAGSGSLKESFPSPSAQCLASRRAHGHGWAGSFWALPSACLCAWEAGRAGGGDHRGLKVSIYSHWGEQ